MPCSRLETPTLKSREFLKCKSIHLLSLFKTFRFLAFSMFITPSIDMFPNILRSLLLRSLLCCYLLSFYFCSYKSISSLCYLFYKWPRERGDSMVRQPSLIYSCDFDFKHFFDIFSKTSLLTNNKSDNILFWLIIPNRAVPHKHLFTSSDNNERVLYFHDYSTNDWSIIEFKLMQIIREIFYLGSMRSVFLIL